MPVFSTPEQRLSGRDRIDFEDRMHITKVGLGSKFITEFDEGNLLHVIKFQKNQQIARVNGSEQNIVYDDLNTFVEFIKRKCRRLTENEYAEALDVWWIKKDQKLRIER